MRLLEHIEDRKLVLGMIHLLPLPGTPFYKEGNLRASSEKALHDASALYEGGADGCVIQTVDQVYQNGDEVDFARLASVAIIVHEVVNSMPGDFQVGIQILFNALNASLAVAQVCGGSFIRSAVFIGATSNSAGIARANPNSFQNYRRKIDAASIAVTAEIHGMHYHDLENHEVVTLAEDAVQAGADAIEIADVDEVVNECLILRIKEKLPHLPVFLGGYTNHENVLRRIRYADGVFVGSCFQSEGWGGRIESAKVREYVRLLR